MGYFVDGMCEAGSQTAKIGFNSNKKLRVYTFQDVYIDYCNTSFLLLT